MKIRRFVAKDMRTALAEIKEELGPDAVIMSNKKTAQGVELMAAVDYGVATPEAKPAEPAQTRSQSKAPAPQQAASAQKWDGFEQQFSANASEGEQAPADSLQALLQRQNQPKASAQGQVSPQPPVQTPSMHGVDSHTAQQPAVAPTHQGHTESQLSQASYHHMAQAQQAQKTQTNLHTHREPTQTESSFAEIQQAIAGEDQEQLNLSQELIDFSARLAQAQAQNPELADQHMAARVQQPVGQSSQIQQNSEQGFGQQTHAQPEPAYVTQAPTQQTHQHTPPFVAEQAANMVNHQQQSAQSLNNDAELVQMRNEMSYMRKLLEEQVSGLMWQDMARKEPMRAMLVKRLMNLGLTETVADQLACFIPDDMGEKEAWHQVKEMLAGQINTTNNDIIHRGGVVALVGPTGVGKTTTIAKLAARFSQIHGADQLALISADSYRIAGHEQLATYGKIIGCPVKLAKNAQQLNELLIQFKHKKLILIDTAGMGQRDLRLAEQLAQLVQSSHVKIRNYLVLAANAQQRVLQDSVERFKKVPLAGCVFTKVDEALSVGEIIATSIQNCLPIGYLTDGQRVPEDIRVANAGNLVTMAEQLAQEKPKGYDWMPEAHSQNVS